MNNTTQHYFIFIWSKIRRFRTSVVFQKCHLSLSLSCIVLAVLSNIILLQ